MTVKIDFTPEEDFPIWHSILCWMIVIGILVGFVNYCVKPVATDIGNALIKASQKK